MGLCVVGLRCLHLRSAGAGTVLFPSGLVYRACGASAGWGFAASVERTASTRWIRVMRLWVKHMVEASASCASSFLEASRVPVLNHMFPNTASTSPRYP